MRTRTVVAVAVVAGVLGVAASLAVDRSWLARTRFGQAILQAGPTDAAGPVARVGERQMLTFRGRRVPCVALADVFGQADPRRFAWGSKTLVLMRLASDEIFALGVDRVHDHEDVVVKPIAPAIMETKLYGGTTLLDDGRPIMLLDIPSIAAQRGLNSEVKNRVGRDEDRAAAAAAKVAVPVMLFLGLDDRKRAIRLETVRRIDTIQREAIDIEGTRAQVVVGSDIFDLAGHEGGALTEGRCRLLRLSDGDSELAYIVREVVDASAMTEDLVPVADDPAIEGVTLIDGELVPLLDGHRLFARRNLRARKGSAPTCRVPVGSEWSRTILEPLVKAAGYAITTDGDTETDVAIVMSEEEPGEGLKARATIRLTADPDGEGDAIYRYDREALLGALRKATRKRAR